MGFVLTFVILGVLWVGHHNQYYYIRRADGLLLWINIFFMMSVAMLPFSAEVFSAYGQDRIAIILYNFNLNRGRVLHVLPLVVPTRDNHLLGPENRIGDTPRRLAAHSDAACPVPAGNRDVVFSVQLSIVIDILVPLSTCCRTGGSAVPAHPN